MPSTPTPTAQSAHVSSSSGVTRVQVDADGRMAGNVLVSTDGDLVLMRFAMAHGHLPAATRRDLVDQAFQLPELDGGRQQVQAVIPLGDVELLQGLRAHLSGIRSRAAGATCLIEATTR